MREAGRPDRRSVTRRKVTRSGVRAPIRAVKRRNGRGAKGGREVEPWKRYRRNINRRQCPPGLNKAEKPRTSGPGWNRRCGRHGCWQPSNKGVKGGRWFSLMDKVYAPANLAAAWKRVRSNRGAAGVDGQSVARFERDAQKYLDELHRQLRDGTYRPSPVRRRWISKPGTTKRRPLGIPTIRDRIVQTALRHVIEPIWEVKFADQSYGFRPGRSCKDALRRVQTLLRSGSQVGRGCRHPELLRQHRPWSVARGSGEGGRRRKVLGLIEALLGQPVMEDTTKWTPEEGIPQDLPSVPCSRTCFFTRSTRCWCVRGTR